MSESPVPLPEQPSLEQLRNQAKDLRRTSGIPLWEAQLGVARRYGFTSWARLKRHVELLTRYSRFPERVATDSDAGTFLRLACLSYYDDESGAVGAGAADPGARAGARRGQRLCRGRDGRRRRAAPGAGGRPRARPRGKAGHSSGSRCATSRTPGTTRRSAGRRSLETAAAAARRRRRPERRLPLARPAHPVHRAHRRLRRRRAGPVRQPRHPHSLALARLLLEAGADPNDGQALYNRMFEPGNDHLELLFEFGLGTGDGGPWRRRLGDALDTPARDGSRPARAGRSRTA